MSVAFPPSNLKTIRQLPETSMALVARKSTLQRMQPVPGSAQVLQTVRGRDVGQDQFHPCNMLRMNPTSIASFVQALQSAMPEANDHGKCRSDKYSLSIVLAG